VFAVARHNGDHALGLRWAWRHVVSALCLMVTSLLLFSVIVMMMMMFFISFMPLPSVCTRPSKQVGGRCGCLPRSG
jgi:hypothetical protein